MKRHGLRTALISGMVVSALGTLFCGGRVAAHDWYPMECCHGLDCAPVLDVRNIAPISSGAAPTMIVTTRSGSVAVPADFPRRESKDNKMHACMRPGPTGRMHLLCLFIPPLS